MASRKAVIGARLRDALLEAGATAKMLTDVEAALKPKPKFRLKREGYARLCELVQDEGVAVVTRGKIYTLAGYKQKMEAGAKHLKKYSEGRRKKPEGKGHEGRVG